MNSRHTAVVDVGTPSGEFHDNEWATAQVRYHGFAGLATVRGRHVDSSEFACLGHQWRVRLYPGGRSRSQEGMVGITLRNMSEESVKVVSSFSIKNSDGRDALTDQDHLPRTQPRGHSNVQAGPSNFVKRADLLSNLVAGALVLEIQMKLSDSLKPSSQFIAENPLCNMMLKTFMDEESADVVFEVEEGVQQVQKTRQGSQSSVTKFHAHRLILQQCAPMLAELCGSGAGSTSVPINGVKPEIFRHILYYVYGGKVSEEDLKLHATEIIDAADRFSVVRLKLEAEACYVRSTKISVDNMMELLLYADSLNCALLKEAVMDFIVENKDEVLEQISLKDVPGGLFADLLAAVARKEKKADSNIEGNDKFSLMSISDLRRKLHEKGLDIDGSRETLIASLKENV